MDTQRVYNNANLEKKRRKKLKEEAAIEAFVSSRKLYLPKPTGLFCSVKKTTLPG
jgi:hypothetical protein